MIEKELAKIANKLDGLGLTKEADVLDLYLAKLAAASAAEGSGLLTDAPKLTPSSLIQEYPTAGTGFPTGTAPAPAKKRMATSWEDYARLTNGTDAAMIRQAWEAYAQPLGMPDSFSDYVAWWKKQKQTGFLHDGNIDDVILLLGNLRAKNKNLTTHDVAVSDKGPDIGWGTKSPSFGGHESAQATSGPAGTYKDLRPTPGATSGWTVPKP